ncbi:unnamed protein product [Amoebophrya sp. A25]|nr:unnamed protein product [Amoebophrya sp. A25]|eukprot:GSA25T00024454001.1
MRLKSIEQSAMASPEERKIEQDLRDKMSQLKDMNTLLKKLETKRRQLASANTAAARKELKAVMAQKEQLVVVLQAEERQAKTLEEDLMDARMQRDMTGSTQFRMQLMAKLKGQIAAAENVGAQMQAEIDRKDVILPEHKKALEKHLAHYEELKKEYRRLELVAPGFLNRDKSGNVVSSTTLAEQSQERKDVAAAAEKERQKQLKKKGRSDADAEDSDTADMDPSVEMLFGLKLVDDEAWPPRIAGFATSKYEAFWSHCKLRIGDFFMGIGTDAGEINPTGNLNKAACDPLLKLVSLMTADIRPIYIERRRIRRDEMVVIFKKENESKLNKAAKKGLELKQLTERAGKKAKCFEKLGLFFVPDKDHPVRVLKDAHHAEWWTAQGVQPGAQLVDVNGHNVEFLNYKLFADRLGALFKTMRPLTLVFRTKDVNQQTVVADYMQREATIMETQKFKLDGTHQIANQLRTKMQAASVNWPEVYLSMRRMSFRPMRSRALHLQGATSQMALASRQESRTRAGSQAAAQGLARRRLPGGLEEEIMKDSAGHANHSRWKRVSLFRGERPVGHVLMSARILYKDMRPHRLYPNAVPALFESQSLRQLMAKDVPPSIRVRIYVVRATSVGTGLRPHLFFRFGSTVKKYEPLQTDIQEHNAADLGRTGVMFYRLEEHDVTFPVEGQVEIGLYSSYSNVPLAQAWQDTVAGTAGSQQQKLAAAYLLANGTGGKNQRAGGNAIDENSFIGSTVIDLQERWASPEWQKLNQDGTGQVPIERRSLWSLDGTQRRGGVLEMWLEMIDTERASVVPPATLQPPPASEVEIRVVVWTLSDITMMVLEQERGEPTDSADLTVKGTFDSLNFRGNQPKTQTTDTHFLSTGFAEYNWRFVFSNVWVRDGFPLEAELQIGLFNSRFLSADFLMGETTLDLRQYITYVAHENKKIELNAEVPMANQGLGNILASQRAQKEALADQLRQFGLTGKDPGGSNRRAEALMRARQLKKKQSADQLVERLLTEMDQENEALRNAGDAEIRAERLPPVAKMFVQIQILPQGEASQTENKVGLGREEPNRDPPLPFPTTGRSWESVLPSTAAALEAASDLYQALTGTACRCIYLVGFLIIVGLWSFLYDMWGCRHVLQTSCCEGACGGCSYVCDSSATELPTRLYGMCYWIWTSGADVTTFCGQQCGGNCNVEPICASDCKEIETIAGLTRSF